MATRSHKSLPHVGVSNCACCAANHERPFALFDARCVGLVHRSRLVKQTTGARRELLDVQERERGGGDTRMSRGRAAPERLHVCVCVCVYVRGGRGILRGRQRDEKVAKTLSHMHMRAHTRTCTHMHCAGCSKCGL